MIQRFDAHSLPEMYQKLARQEFHFQDIIKNHGLPPVWVRPNTFETLVLTILEQQVSLASAYAAYKKLREKIQITPANLLSLSDEELRSCYLSRQKIQYTRALATAVQNNEINFIEFESLPEEIVRTALKKIKGIGDWTVDIYLIHALQRADVFPVGDLALVNSIRMRLKSPQLSRESILAMSHKWKPYRSAATMLFWHYYIRERGIKVEEAGEGNG